MKHRCSDAIDPQPPYNSSNDPPLHISDDKKNTRYQEQMQPVGDMVNGESIAYRPLASSGGSEIEQELSAQHMQAQEEEHVEVDARPPPLSRMIVESIPPLPVVLSTPHPVQRSGSYNWQLLEKMPPSDGEQVGAREHCSLSCSTITFPNKGGANLPLEAASEGVLSNVLCMGSLGGRSTDLQPIPSQGTHTSRLSSALSIPAAGVGTSGASLDPQLPWKPITANRFCYMPEPLLPPLSNNSHSHSGGGAFCAFLGAASRAVTQPCEDIASVPNEFSQDHHRSDSRVSPLSLTSETASIAECTPPTPVRQGNECMARGFSLQSPSPSKRTDTFTGAPAATNVLPAPATQTSDRPAPQVPPAYLLTGNPLSQQRRLSDRYLGEHVAEAFSCDDDDTLTTVVIPYARHLCVPSSSLRSCAGTGQECSRTPPIAVLVPLAPGPVAPAPTLLSPSLPSTQTQESDTYQVNADSLTSEMSLRSFQSTSLRSHQEEPSAVVEPRASVRVSPLHPFLSQLYLPSSSPHSAPARSPAHDNGDPTLLDYVAGLKPPRGSSSIRGSLLCVGCALCAAPLCGVVLLLCLHYWAVTFQERAYATAALRPHTGPMLTTNFTLMLGILLAFVVMGGGSGAALYAGLYRRAIRHHLRAFALCVRLADAWSSPDVHHLAGEGATPIGATVPGAQRSANGNNSPYKLSPFVTRWHEEVSRLVNHLTCPIEVSQAEWCSFLASERRSIVWPHENGNASFDRSATATALDGDVCCNTNRFLPSDGQSSGPAAENEALSPLGTQPGSRYRMNEAFFSRRPQHPVAVSKRQEAVTVVVCRLIDPMGLLTDQSPLTRAQLEELQRLSNDFHQRLRAVPRTPYAAITEVGVSEVVFSFNTVSPLPSLVASPAAMALALAAHKALVEWRPTYLGTPLQWGIAVHRFDAYMCPTRGMPGRLYISFGTVEYDFARLLAELAALFDHGVLCHAGFLADASCESQSLPVDYVMDLRQQAFLVYQLHDSDVDKEHRQQMNSAIVAMRNGEYKAAADALDVWMKRSDGCGGLPRAAARLRYVASFLERAVRQRQPHASEGHVTSGNSPSFLPATQGVAEWAVEGLRMSYSRPPPVWEEEEAPVPITPQLLSPDVRSTSSIMTTGKGGSRRLRARQCQSSHVLVPPLAIKSRGDTGERAAFLRGSPHRSSSFRTPHISPVQQVEEPLQPRELDTLLYHPRQGSVAVEEDSGLLLSSQRRDRQLSFASEFVPRGGNVLDVRSPPSLSPHNIGGGGGSYSPPATRPVFEMPTPTAALHDKSGDRMWAALTLLTESDQSTLTTTAPRPRLCSNSWSFAESGVPEMPTLTPMHSATWLPSHLDMRWQRHASILLPALKTDEGAQSAAAPTCAPQRGNGAARSSQRGRHDIGYGESGRPLCGDDTLPAADLQTGDGKWPPQLLGPRVDSESSNTTIALLPLEVSHESALACSDSARRHTPASTAVAVSSILPLFPEIRIPFTAPERPEARSEADVFSEADVTQEPSMMSVVQRSRSRLSQRATAQLSNVVCSRTNRIGSSSSDAVIVFQGFHPDGYLVAVKRVSRPAERQIALLRNEVEILRELHHRNIVNIVSTWNDDEAEYMAMEYACETLASVLQKFKVLLSGVVRFYTRELLNALVYLHRDCGVIHRDLSPNNVIITSTTDRSRVKLIDFGHSVMIPHFCGGSSALSVTVPGSVSLEFTERRLSHSTVSVTDVVMPVVGTPLFMSPQACQGLVHPANDVWSLGIIVHLCLTGTYPYPSGTLTDPETFIANVGSGRLTPVLVDSCEMTEEARSFIEQCFTLDHTDRPLAAALLKHSFVEQ